jgi:hypothetical protein
VPSWSLSLDLVDRYPLPNTYRLHTLSDQQVHQVSIYHSPQSPYHFRAAVRAHDPTCLCHEQPATHLLLLTLIVLPSSALIQPATHSSPTRIVSLSSACKIHTDSPLAYIVPPYILVTTCLGNVLSKCRRLLFISTRRDTLTNSKEPQLLSLYVFCVLLLLLLMRCHGDFWFSYVQPLPPPPPPPLPSPPPPPPPPSP